MEFSKRVNKTGSQRQVGRYVWSNYWRVLPSDSHKPDKQDKVNSSLCLSTALWRCMRKWRYRSIGGSEPSSSRLTLGEIASGIHWIEGSMGPRAIRQILNS